MRVGATPGQNIPQRLLLVEGPDDSHAIYHLMQHHGLHNLCTIEAGGGVERILDSLEARILTANQERLGIILDVDDDASDAVERRWTRIRDILDAAGYRNVPRTPKVEGTIVERETRPAFGAWLMLDNVAPGTLEDFCRLLIPASDLLWTRATHSVASIPSEERRFRPQHVAKAEIHTWLAWQEEPGRPIGQAITKKYLDAGAPHAVNLVTWLRSLFDIDVA